MSESNAHPSSVSFRTCCDRALSVGWLPFDGVGDPAHPAARVTLSAEIRSYDGARMWASLTPQEARRLGAALITQAATAERSGSSAPAWESTAVTVHPVGAESYSVSVRG